MFIFLDINVKNVKVINYLINVDEDHAPSCIQLIIGLSLNSKVWKNIDIDNIWIIFVRVKVKNDQYAF